MKISGFSSDCHRATSPTPGDFNATPIHCTTSRNRLEPPRFWSAAVGDVAPVLARVALVRRPVAHARHRDAPRLSQLSPEAWAAALASFLPLLPPLVQRRDLCCRTCPHQWSPCPPALWQD